MDNQILESTEDAVRYTKGNKSQIEEGGVRSKLKSWLEMILSDSYLERLFKDIST